MCQLLFKTFFLKRFLNLCLIELFKLRHFLTVILESKIMQIVSILLFKGLHPLLCSRLLATLMVIFRQQPCFPGGSSPEKIIRGSCWTWSSPPVPPWCCCQYAHSSGFCSLDFLSVLFLVIAQNWWKRKKKRLWAIKIQNWINLQYLYCMFYKFAMLMFCEALSFLLLLLLNLFFKK